jgi:hypothetical protein
MTDQKQAHYPTNTIDPSIVKEETTPTKIKESLQAVPFGVSDHRENAYHVKRGTFPLPSVTVSSNPKRAREKREREQRRCTAGRVFRWTLIAFAIAYCKEISGFMNGLIPQTVISAPRIRGDYTSIKGIHDLSSAKVKPLCFVSFPRCYSVIFFDSSLSHLQNGSLEWGDRLSMSRPNGSSSRYRKSMDRYPPCKSATRAIKTRQQGRRSVFWRFHH